MAAEQPKKNAGPAKKKKVSDEFQEDSVFQAPEIIREPSSRQAKLGSNVVLRVTASGKPLPGYQWFHNGKKISGANTDRLTLSKVRRASAGAYHCEVKNHAGKAVSRQCMLSFFTQKVPKLVLNERELKVEEGKPISLKVVTTDPAAFKEFRVFWVFNGMRIKGAYGLELNISAGKKKYEGEYKAMISVGSGIETSNVCKITITPAKAVSKVHSTPPPADEAQVDGTMVGTLSPSPLGLAEATAEAVALPAPEPKAAANDWEDFLFNPEDEGGSSDEEGLTETTAQDEGTKEFDSREIRMSAKEADELLAANQPSPLDIIEGMKEQPEEEPVLEAPAEVEEIPEELGEEDFIADWGSLETVKAPPPKPTQASNVMPITEKLKKAAPNPQLMKKKAFLESVLARWQKNIGKNGKQAA